MHFSKATTLATFAATVSAYSATERTFAVNHFYGKGALVEGRMDPIIDPGVASGHVHTIQGGNAFALSMEDHTPMTSTCTSSLVKNDLSNYWTPKLYFQSDNGSLHDVELFYMNVYYFFEPTTDKITAFQPGHRMVIGNPTLRTPPATGGGTILDLSDGTPQPVQFTCPRSSTSSPLYPVNSDGLHGAGIQDPNNKGAGVGFPDQNCDGYASPLRADVHFPSCYDPSQGLDAYKTNMQFPTNGNCPSGWIHTPHLFYEVYWDTPKFASEWTPGQGKQPFVLANGDPTGYGLHADFISGWDVDTLQQIIDNCNAGDAGMDKCPGLIGGLNDPSTSCNIPSAIEETITGVFDTLPGNNTVGQWGKNAVAGTAAAGIIASSAVVAVDSAANTAHPINSIVNVADTTKSPSAPIVAAAPYPATTILTTIRQGAAAPTPVAVSSSPSSGNLASGWAYKGCYTDNRDVRVLSGIKFADIGNKQVTNTKCQAHCGAHGYSLAGTEYGGQCFCGDALEGSTTTNESECDMVCEGDGTQTCGGGLTLSVYTTSVIPKRRNAFTHRHLGRHIRELSQ